MDRKTTAIGGIILLTVLFFGINILGDVVLRGDRIDLTEDKLYTLSEGTRNILKKTDEPISLTLYFSESLAKGRPDLQSYGKRVRELIEEYSAVSGGVITVETVDPEPFSEAEDKARASGIASVPLNASEQFYFGLVGANSTDGREVIRFFDPSQERFLEYNLTRLVYNLANPEKKTVGVISSLPIDGSEPNPGIPTQPQPAWQIMREIRSTFDVRTIEPTAAQIDKDVDVLLLVHPKNLDEPMLRAIDQYVIGGGKAIVFVDPLCEMDIPPGAQQNPLSVMNADRSSSLAPLLAAWGVSFDPEKVAADRDHAMRGRAPDGRSVVPYIHYISLDKESVDQADAVTGDLTDLQFGISGFIAPEDGATTTFTPLITTSPEAMVLDRSKVAFFPQPDELLAAYKPGGKPLTIAARISGTARSAYAPSDRGENASSRNGASPSPSPAGAPNPTDAPAPDAASPAQEVPGGALAQEEIADVTPASTPAEGDINVIVVADVDMLTDRMWVQEMRLGNQVLGYQKLSDNGDFLLSALDNMAGSTDLISVRARGTYQRPFTLVEDIQRKADEKYLAQLKDLETKRREAQQKITELQRAKPESGDFVLSPEQRAEIDKFQQTLTSTNAELRDVRYNMRKDVERLGFWLKVINIGAAPLLVALAAIGLGAYRAARRRSDRRAMAGQG